MGYLMQPTPQRRQGQESSRPYSVSEIYGQGRKSKSRCGSSKAKRHVKITSRFRHGGLRLIRFVLQSSSIYSPFFLARFGCVNIEVSTAVWSACVCLCCYLFSQHVRLRSAYLYETRAVRVYVRRHGESFRSVYGLLGRFFVVLLSCHFTRHVYCQPKKPRNMKPIKWKRSKLLTSCCTCADKLADYFDIFQ